MAGLESLRIAPDVERPAAAASHAAAGMEIYVPGLIDPGKEKERLVSKRAKLAELKAQVESIDKGLKAPD